MSPAKVGQIARREFLARVRSKAFVFSTLLPPLMIVLFGSLSGLMSRADVDEIRVRVVDAGTGLGAVLEGRLADIGELPLAVGSTVTTTSSLVEEARSELSAAIRADELDGYLVLRPDPSTALRATYYARETGNPVILSVLRSAVRTALLESRFSGDDLREIRSIQSADLETVTVSSEGEQIGGFEVGFFSTYFLAMLLYMGVLIQGGQMATAIVQEKSSRLVELIIGAVTATEYMVGKIIGVLGSGLLQLLVWLVGMMIGLLYVLPGMMMASEMSGVELGSLVTPGLVFYLVLFFLLGYVLYISLYAAVGATCSSSEELQHAIFPVMLPVMLAFFATFYVSVNPNSLISRVLSFIPFFTPMVLFARINVAEPPLWEIWLGIAVLVAGALLCVWVAAKIFRVAILMHGKRPALGEILRMVRAA